MTVYEFHCDVKRTFCQILNVQPSDVCSQTWCKHMFPKTFFFSCLRRNVDSNTEHLVCHREFFQYLKNKITISKCTDGYLQCLLILLRYAALFYKNVVKNQQDPYYFLTWFEPDDIRMALEWQENLNADRTSFSTTEYLKLDHLVFSTIICHLITISFETIPQCKNLISYYQLLTTPQKRHKPIKLITYQNGLTEKEAKILRQIFEHIKITRSIVDDQVGNLSVIKALRNNENPYKNSALVTEETYRQGFKNIFIPIQDDTSNFWGLLLLDGKKSKTLENDYFNSLVVYSLASNTEHILVDSIVFDHNLILNAEKNFYDSSHDDPTTNNVGLLIQGLNNLLLWCLPQEIKNEQHNLEEIFFSTLKEQSEFKEKNKKENHFIPIKDDYEKCRQEFGTFIKDALLYQYQAGDIENYFQLLKEKRKAEDV